MRKFILFFILLVLFLSFCALVGNSYLSQSKYYSQKAPVASDTQENETTPVEVPSKYINYTKEDYDKAIIENRVIVLFFTSNWCVECTKQSDKNKEVFSELNTGGIVGLQLHILDSETTTESDALAKKFDVQKESSFVILDKKGAVFFRYVGDLEKDLLKGKIAEAGDIK